MDVVSFTNRGPAFDQHMRFDFCIPADGHMFADDRVRPDHHVFSQVRFLMHYCCLMNIHSLLPYQKSHLSTIMAINSASATTAPSTSAWALKPLIFDRDLFNSSSKRT